MSSSLPQTLSPHWLCCLVFKVSELSRPFYLALTISSSEDSRESVEDAVKYIIFLVDANSLFDTALGMYDFPLTLLIAQHSQRVRTTRFTSFIALSSDVFHILQDPREYIPFLRELRKLPSPYQRFSINDHLKRYPKALLGLRDSGKSHYIRCAGCI